MVEKVALQRSKVEKRDHYRVGPHRQENIMSGSKVKSLKCYSYDLICTYLIFSDPNN